MTVHALKLQISSNIDLRLVVSCNDSEAKSTSTRRVDQQSRTAHFEDEVLSVKLDGIRGRVLAPSSSNSTSKSGTFKDSSSKKGDFCGNFSDAASQQEEERNDLVFCNVKLFAVSDKRQKLIGVVNFPVDWKN